MPNLSIHQLTEIIGGQLSMGTMPPLGGDLEPVGRVVTDSHAVLPGDLFWGLDAGPGYGAQFAEEAMFRAAQGAVVAGRHIEPWAGRFSIQVRDTRHALLEVARWTRRCFPGAVIGLVGEPHRRVAASLTHQLLQPSMPGSCGGEAVGDEAALAMTMLNWHAENEYVILDIGATHDRNIAAISHLCSPDIIAINSPHKVTHHQATRDRKARAEVHARFFETLPGNTSVVINGDDPSLREAARNSSIETISVGCGCDSDVMATNVRCHDRQLTFDVDGLRFQLPVWGRHFLTQTLIAIAIGRLLSVPLDAMKTAARNVKIPRGFGDLRCIAGVNVIDDARIASPDSLKVQLESLAELAARGRRWVVCGDLEVNDLEASGPQATDLHRELGQMIVTRCGADRLICCGAHATEVSGAAVAAGFSRRHVEVCLTGKAVADRLAREMTPGDVVLVSGCRSTELEIVIQQFAERYPSAAA